MNRLEKLEYYEPLDLLKTIMIRFEGQWNRLKLAGEEAREHTTRVNFFAANRFEEIPEAVAGLCAEHSIASQEIDFVVKIDYQSHTTWLAYSTKRQGQSLVLNTYQGNGNNLGYFVTITSEALILISFRLSDPASYEKVILLSTGQLRYRKFVLDGMERRELNRTEIKVGN